MNVNDILKDLNLTNIPSGKDLEVYSPIDGNKIANLKTDDERTLNDKISKAVIAFNKWRNIPAPKRGELIRIFGHKLRQNKEALAKLVTLECGKILEEGKGEVQEMIDICDFAVGLSRTIGGLTMPSERPEHIMQENWLPLGVIGIISAFNFPVAVWAWNAALAIICGNSIIWKPSSKTPLTALACQAIFEQAIKEFEKLGNKAPKNLSQVTICPSSIGNTLVSNKNIALISATGSCAMGHKVGVEVAKRFGKSLLELGGNNAVIVTPTADLNIALPSIIFGSVGTAGQRCTSTRRVFAYKSIYEDIFNKLKSSYNSLNSKIGNPLETNTLIGPLIDKKAYQTMQESLKIAKKDAEEIIGGQAMLTDKYPNAAYVSPALVKLKKQVEIVYQETFAPILYVMPYDNLEEAIAMHNDVSQGLSSAIFTNNLREAEIFKQYSDCGIANVNIGTSGAEIGGAFGGEKETGGGRESGSDAWKSYMRRQTSTTYYGNSTPALAQNIKFEF